MNGWALLTGAAVTAPSLYDAFVVGSVPADTALTRLAVSTVVVSVAVGLLQWLIASTSPPSPTALETARRLAAASSPEGSAPGAGSSGTGSSGAGQGGSAPGVPPSPPAPLEGR